jgi:hypothetical protein
VPVHAAIVDSKTAAQRSTMAIKGGKKDFWGFYVAWYDPDGKNVPNNTVTYDVPTKSLSALEVRTPGHNHPFVTCVTNRLLSLLCRVFKCIQLHETILIKISIPRGGTEVEVIASYAGHDVSQVV